LPLPYPGWILTRKGVAQRTASLEGRARTRWRGGGHLRAPTRTEHYLPYLQALLPYAAPLYYALPHSGVVRACTLPPHTYRRTAQLWDLSTAHLRTYGQVTVAACLPAHTHHTVKSLPAYTYPAAAYTTCLGRSCDPALLAALQGRACGMVGCRCRHLPLHGAQYSHPPSHHTAFSRGVFCSVACALGLRLRIPAARTAQHATTHVHLSPPLLRAAAPRSPLYLHATRILPHCTCLHFSSPPTTRSPILPPPLACLPARAALPLPPHCTAAVRCRRLHPPTRTAAVPRCVFSPSVSDRLHTAPLATHTCNPPERYTYRLLPCCRARYPTYRGV